MTQKRMTKTERERIEKANVRAETFVQALARDLYVQWAGKTAALNTDVAHAAMSAAIAYFQALATFRPAPPAPYAPAQTAAAQMEFDFAPTQTVGEILDEAEAAGALPRPLTEDEYGEAREIAGDLAAEAAREASDELPEIPNADEGSP